ncbi:MAG: hypothetical protein JO140_02495 [Candidatus Eremiobacteraeota bacterium]|nr:hypothetical protein [Candidatus Eremiobacteraeota bacterium]
MNSLQLRARLALAAVVVATLAFSLLLAFVTARIPVGRSSDVQVQARAAFTPAPVAIQPAPESMWTSLAPFSFTVDLVAVLGLAAIFAVRSGARFRRGAAT